MDKENKQSYDDEPVYYCKRCLSLNIKQMPFVPDQDYCANCGTAEIGTTTIEEWNEMYKKKYGHEHITKITKKELKWPYWC